MVIWEKNQEKIQQWCLFQQVSFSPLVTLNLDTLCLLHLKWIEWHLYQLAHVVIWKDLECNNILNSICMMGAFYLLSANPTKWSNTLKQFVGKLPTNCLSVFDHFVKLVLKGLKEQKVLFWKIDYYFCLPIMSHIKLQHAKKVEPVWVQILIFPKKEKFLLYLNTVTFIYLLCSIMLQHFK